MNHLDTLHQKIFKWSVFTEIIWTKNISDKTIKKIIYNDWDFFDDKEFKYGYFVECMSSEQKENIKLKEIIYEKKCKTSENTPFKYYYSECRLSYSHFYISVMWV